MLKNSDFVHLFEDGTKSKIPFEIKAPLTVPINTMHIYYLGIFDVIYCMIKEGLVKSFFILFG